ncbi:MAG: hypothetical protein M3281_04275, partial [Chloroflexota bacterium]|nr:hypothetical protein [Chloroflexota bacterium]
APGAGNTVGDFATAVERDPWAVRSVASPLIPALYSFVARRSADIGDAEDLLVETLVRARALAPAFPTQSAPMLPWLLGLAARLLAEDLQHPVELQTGLRPGSAPAKLSGAAARLPRAERQALGMYCADGYEVEIIAQALGKDPRTVASLLERAVASLVQSEGERVRDVLEALHAQPVQLSVSRSQEARIWGRFEEEHETFSPVRPAGSRPPWLRTLSSLAAGVLLLVCGGLWYLSRPAEEQPDTKALAAPPTAPPAAATRAPSTDLSLASSSPSYPQPAQGSPSAGWGPGQTQSVVRHHRGQVYFVQRGARGRVSLMVADFEAPLSGAVPTIRTLVSRSGGSTLPYAVAPDGEQIAYGDGGGVWLRHRSGGPRELLLTLKDPPIPPRIRGSAGSLYSPHRWRAGELAWRPDGRVLALVAEPADDRNPFSTRIQLFELSGRRKTPHPYRAGGSIAALAPGERVYELSWNLSGSLLLANTSQGVRVIDTEQGYRSMRLHRPAYRGYWSPLVDRLLLWTGSGKPGTTRPFGLAQADTPKVFPLSRAAHAGWRSDGLALLVARLARTPGSHRQDLAFTLWERGGKKTSLARISQPPDACGDVAFGPDGGHLACGGKDGLYLMHFRYSGRVQALTTSTGRVSSVRWVGGK